MSIIDSLPRDVGTKVVATICSFLPPNETDQVITQVWERYSKEPLVAFERIKAHADPQFTMRLNTPDIIGTKRYKNQDPTGETVGRYVTRRMEIDSTRLTTEEQGACICSRELGKVKSHDQLEKEFRSYPNLTSLSVRRWNIKEKIPENSSLRRLEKLSLCLEPFLKWDRVGEFLENLPNLTTLHIGSDELVKHFFPYILFDLLEDLSLSDTQLKDADLERLKGPKLKRLTLYSHEITGSFSKNVSFDQLEELTLLGMRLRDESLTYLHRYQLKKLMIDTLGPMRSPLTGSFLSGLSENLEELVMKSPLLKDESLAHLRRYRQLRKLDIYSIGFGDFYKSSLTGSFLLSVPVERLEEISLQGDRIQGEFLVDFLERHHNLTSEEVYINSVTAYFFNWNLSLEVLERLLMAKVVNMQLTCLGSLDLLKNILIWCSQKRNPCLERLEIRFYGLYKEKENSLIIKQDHDTYSVTTHFPWESIDIVFLEEILNHPELQDTYWNGRDQCLEELERRNQSFSLNDCFSRIKAVYKKFLQNF